MRKSEDAAKNLKERHGEDCKDSRPQEDYGHYKEHRLPQVRQADAHRKARERPRTRHPRRNFHFLLGLRIPREVVIGRLALCDFNGGISPATGTGAARNVSTTALGDWLVRTRQSIAPARSDRETLQSISTKVHSLPGNSTRIAA